MRLQHRASQPRFRDNLRIIAFAVLIPIVLTLAILQYHWVDAASTAREMQARAQLNDHVKNLTAGFDAEITAAGFLFEFAIAPAPTFSHLKLPPGSKASGAMMLQPHSPSFPQSPPSPPMDSALKQDWAAWKRDAHWPQLLSGVALIEHTNDGLHAIWAGTPAKADVRAVLPDFKPPAQTDRALGFAMVHEQNQAFFFDGKPALLHPLMIRFEEPGKFHMRWLLIHFDQQHITDVVMPELLSKFMTNEERSEYAFHIVRRDPEKPVDALRSGSSATPPGKKRKSTVVADLFHYRVDCMAQIPFSPHHATGASPPSFVFGAGPESSSPPVLPPPVPFERMSLESLRKAVNDCGAPERPASRGLLQLVVERKQSWDNIYAQFRWHNLLTSALVLAALCAALVVLVVSMERTRRLAKLQTILATGISHELRTPLTSLRIAADDLKRGHVTSVEEIRRYGDIIDAQSKRLAHIVDHTIALSTARHWDGLQQAQAVSLVETVTSVLDLLAKSLREAEIEVETLCDAHLPLISGDPDLVQRCVINLIENVIKYAASGKWIRLAARTRRGGDRVLVELTVEDRGPGISDEEKDAIFEAFYRGMSALQSRLPGSGLGLAIVKSAMEAQGGWIEFDPALPHGCKFRLVFIADDHPPHIATPPKDMR